MKRRDFLKIAGLTPAAIMLSCNRSDDTIQEIQKQLEFSEASDKTFPTLEVEGTHYEIGQQVGKQFGENIRNVIKARPDWIKKITSMVQTGESKDYASKLKENVKNRFPQLLEEAHGLADGAELSRELIWAMTIKSELDAFSMMNPGCSTIFVNQGANKWLFHNEDGHAAYDGNMFLLKAHMPSKVTFYSLVYAGLLPGVGPSMNDYGIIETTNFIGCTKPLDGIPRYYLGRAILETKTLDEAIKTATSEPRAFPWHHHLASTKSKEYASVETLPDGRTEIRKPEGIYVHTNHLTGEKTKNYEDQDTKYMKTSSLPRFNTITKLKNNLKGPVESPDIPLSWLSSHEGRPYSPCRHPEGDILGQTLGSAFFDINKGTMRILKGNPCKAATQGLSKEYSF